MVHTTQKKMVDRRHHSVHMYGSTRHDRCIIVTLFVPSSSRRTNAPTRHVASRSHPSHSPPLHGLVQCSRLPFCLLGAHQLWRECALAIPFILLAELIERPPLPRPLVLAHGRLGSSGERRLAPELGSPRSLQMDGDQRREVPSKLDQLEHERDVGSDPR
jgi:hypothetical protein